MSERLLTIAEDVLDAWRSERAVFRRAELDGAQLSVRRGPGTGPLRVTITSATTSPDNEGTTLADVPARGFVLSCARLALGLTEALERADQAQTKNLRLRALSRSARSIVDVVSETNANDSLQIRSRRATRASACRAPLRVAALGSTAARCASCRVG